MQESIKKLVAPLGITALTPIQEDALAHYKDYQELVLYAPTGTGKTLAFLLPLIELLRENEAKKGIQALILSPTRELATQIEAVFKSLKSEFSITACYGGHALSAELRNLAANPQVVVGTPGRIVDHIERQSLLIQDADFLVVDEFDKCLEMGFHEQIASIYGETRDLKKLFFGSATKLEQFPIFISLTHPFFIDRTKQETQPKIELFQVGTFETKLETLKALITEFQNERSIIFCNFREDVEAISNYFKQSNMAIAAYHGGLEQDERERALIKFRNNTEPVLVCTDIGARGLDIPEVKHIVHYMLPDKEDAFVHRNGRTARMMENGRVYLFESDAKYPKFKLPECKNHKINFNCKYRYPDWKTLYFSGGKKNKINKIDLLGFLCQQGKLEKSAVGVISILDYTSYASVKTKDVRALIEALRNVKVKGQKLKIDIAY